LSPQGKPFVSRTQHSEPVLGTALKYSTTDGKRVASMPHSQIQYLLEYIFNFGFTNNFSQLSNDL